MTVWMIEGRDKHNSWHPARELGYRLFVFTKRQPARDTAKRFNNPIGLGSEILKRNRQRYRVVKREL